MNASAVPVPRRAVSRSDGTNHGKSSSVKKKQAKEVLACVNRALPSPDWAQMPHQHQKYSIAVLATYPPSGGTGGP